MGRAKLKLGLRLDFGECLAVFGPLFLALTIRTLLLLAFCGRIPLVFVVVLMT